MSSIDWNNLENNLEKEIKDELNKIDIQEIGTVVKVADGIVLAEGLSNAMLGELVIFETATKGMVFNLSDQHLGIILLKEDDLIKQGTKIKRSKMIMSVPVGDDLIGRAVNALGEPVDNLGDINITDYFPIETKAPSIMKRSKVCKPLQTGIKIIDSLTPIGLGQRELIIGDRQTGKTSIAIDTILNQKDKNINCVYVAIGQKQSTIKSIYAKLKDAGAMEYTTIICACAADLFTLQYLAPYCGCAMAEYWLSKGKDTLIIYDDLSKHAVAYRTISLLFHLPPGREAYPGDVFYLHSRLLERSANIDQTFGGGSITALPIVETQGGDISSYIPTNIISITDGQIFLQSDLFNSGQKPAVSIGLSVSRVGGDAQSSLIKKLTGSLKTSLSQYLDIKAFSKFGSTVDESTKIILDNGEKIEYLLRQDNDKPLSLAQEAFILLLIKENYIKNIAANNIINFSKNLLDYLNLKYAGFLLQVNNNPSYSEEIIEKMKSIVEEYIKSSTN